MKPSALTLANLGLASVLLLTPFLVDVTTSAPYNPWYDLDENGIINIFDVVALAGTYGTTGNPGKNVTIAGRMSTLAYSFSGLVEPHMMLSTGWIAVDGYSKLAICLANGALDNSLYVRARHTGGSEFFVESLFDFGADLVKTYDVPNQEIRVIFSNNDATAKSLALDIYLIP